MVLLSGLLFLILAWRMDDLCGPDEHWRYILSEWIAVNHKLPTGYEEELQIPIWGYSYAFTPYLPSILAAPLVRLAMFFTSDPQVLLFASRLISVISGAGIIIVSFRIGDKIFERKGSVYFFTALAAYLPQVTFLAGYHNNDIVSLLAAYMVLDAVLDGIKDKWKYKNLIYLSAGLSVCILSYYFGYAWVLFAIAGYFISSFRGRTSAKKVFSKAGLVFLMTFLLAGWYFVRNAVIYNGDFLGFRSQLDLSLEFAAENGIVLPNNPGILHSGLTEMLSGGWIKDTYESFVGLFSGMVIQLKMRFYLMYLAGFILCIFSFIITRNRNRVRVSGTFLAMLLAVIILPVGFSIYSSYMRDYQPQGRYIISILPALAVIFAAGIDGLSELIKSRSSGKNALSAGIGGNLPVIGALALFVMYLVIYCMVMLPTLAFVTLPGADSILLYNVK